MKNVPDNIFHQQPGCAEEGNRTTNSEAMTRFELARKSFADPWLRPLTHIA